MGIFFVALRRAFLLELHASLWLLQGLLDRRFGVVGGLVLMELVDFLAEIVLVARVHFDGRLESLHGR